MSETKHICSSGVSGLDHVLNGGLTTERLYLIEGTPGTGKTTLGLQFLLEGAANDEKVLYITLSETVSELTAVAESHGWDLGPVSLFELVPESGFLEESEQTMFHPSEVELGETVHGVMDRVRKLAPQRVVLDSLSELRLLAQNPLRYRRQILALKQFFATVNCTVLVLDDKSADPGDMQLHSIAHGVIHLEQRISEFGSERRRLHIVKLRGTRYRGGYHDFDILLGGLTVYPRLIASEHHTAFSPEVVSTGSKELDALLGGGLVPGTATLLTGPAGVGKTTTAVQCMVAALKRGERAAYFLFDERLPTLLTRSAVLGLDLQPYIDNGDLMIRQVDPSEMSPGEFTIAVRDEVERRGAKLVLIDSLNAYLQAMPDEQFLLLQMHELLSYLSQQGVVALMILGYHGLVGDGADIDLSYLADAVIQLRFFEASGQVRQAIAVVKTRTTNHERTIREFQISSGGLAIGGPLKDFQGVLSGQPMFSGSAQALMHSAADDQFAKDAQP